MLSDYKENKIFVLYVFSLKTGSDLPYDKKKSAGTRIPADFNRLTI